MAQTINLGDTVIQDPSDIRVYQFDWSGNLGLNVTIADSTFTITPVAPSVDDDALVKDEENTPSNGYVRISGGTLGQTYELANKIVTSDTPAQTKERSFFILIQDQ